MFFKWFEDFKTELTTLVDSAASEHIFNEGRHMKNVEDISPKDIILGDGRTVVARKRVMP